MTARVPNQPDRTDPLRDLFAAVLDIDPRDLPQPGAMQKRGLKKLTKKDRPGYAETAARHRALNHARDCAKTRKPSRNRRLDVPVRACACCERDFQPTDYFRLLCDRCRKGRGPTRMCPYDPRDGFVG